MKVKQKIAIGFIRFKLKLLSLLSKEKAAKEAFRLFSTPFAPEVKKAPAIFEKADPLSFSFNGITIRGYRWSFEGAKKILIIHGFNSQAYKFNRYVQPLLEKGYEVMAFDAPAHGSSEGRTVNAKEYGEMILEVIRRYGPFDGYLSHSFGGIALSLALEQVPHSEATKVVFIAPATETITTIETALDFLHVRDERVKQAVFQIVIELSGKEAGWFSMKRIMYRIKASVLWIHDEDDDTTPVQDALNIRDKHLPHITFMITQGLGHRRIYHDASVRKAVLDFL